MFYRKTCFIIEGKMNRHTEEEVEMSKKLIIVTSPPACGKTYISKELAKRLNHIVYLDKDTLITLSKQIFVVAGQPYNRSSDFFEKNIRDYEYECVVNLALEALEYEDLVLINAPFTREIRDMEYIKGLADQLCCRFQRKHISCARLILRQNDISQRLAP